MNHSEWAQAVKERDGCCQECGTTDNLHAHHIKPRALGGRNALENGEALCTPCHNERHTGNLSPSRLAERFRNGEAADGKRFIIYAYIPSYLKDWLRSKAEREHRSMSAQVEYMLEKMMVA